jgi:ribosomal protein L20
VDTSKYTDPKVRKAYKRATRHPLYRALQKRYVEATTEARGFRMLAARRANELSAKDLTIADLENRLADAVATIEEKQVEIQALEEIRVEQVDNLATLLEEVQEPTVK